MSRDVTIVLKVTDNFSQPLQQFNTQIGGIGTTTDKLGDSTKKTNSALDDFSSSIKAGIVAYAGWKGAEAVSEMFQLGQKVDITSQTFDALTSDIGGAATNMRSLNTATGSTVDNLTLMQGANKLLQMGLVTNSDELSKMAGMAVKLGSSMGMDATKSMSDFSLMLANNSIMRLDQFGISSGEVREKIIELQAATDGLSRSDAFKMAVMEIGSKALEKLGSAATASETPMNRLAATVQNMAQSFAGDFATGVNSVAGILELAAGQNPIQMQQQSQVEQFATANAIAYADRFFNTVDEQFAQAQNAETFFSPEYSQKILQSLFANMKANPGMDLSSIVQNTMLPLTGTMDDEHTQILAGQLYTMGQMQITAEATAKAQQEQAAAQAEVAKQAQIYSNYLNSGGGDDRQDSLASQREAIELGRQRHDAMMLYNNDIQMVGNTLLKVTGDSDPMSMMYTAKLDKSQVADMLPHYMTPEGASEVTNAYAAAEDNLTRLHQLADQKLITDDQLTQAENMTSNLGLMADQAQAAADAYKNLTLAQAFGQTGGGTKGEMSDMVIDQMKKDGKSPEEIAAMQQKLDMNSGRETAASTEMKTEIVPIISKMTSDKAIAAMNNIDSLIKEATLAGLNPNTLAGMMKSVAVTGANYFEGNNLQEYLGMQSGDLAGKKGNGMGGAGAIFDDEKQRNRPGNTKTPTASMAGDMTLINKEATAIDKSTKAIADSTTLAAKAATTIKDTLSKIPDSVGVVFKFTADDPQGLVGLVRALTGGQLTLDSALKERGVPMKHTNNGGQ